MRFAWPHLRASTLLTLALLAAGPLPAHASPEVLSKESVNLNTRLKGDFTLSVYLLENSSWSRKEILARLNEMNDSLRTCGLEVAFVDLYRVSADFGKVRVDDLDATASPDGMQALAALNPRDSNPRFFYFENYFESFSSGGVFPMSVPWNTKAAPGLQNTAWFPFHSSARRQNRSLPYSEEGHEMGHLLLGSGHDSSGTAGIMADKSSIRRNAFTPEQCGRFRMPAPRKLPGACEPLREKLKPTFKRHFETYNQSHYMAQWCVRNSQNLFRSLQREQLVPSENVFAVYAIHQKDDRSIRPRMARWNTASWSNHAFLVIDGLVLDQDFTDGARILPLAEYVDKMWGDESLKMSFQVRPAEKIDDYTNYGVRKSFASGDYPVLDIIGLRSRFSRATCAN